MPICRTRRPLRIVVTSAAPSTVPTTETAPPESSVPPSTGPRKEGRSHSSPPTAGIAAPSRATTISAGDGGEHAGERVADDDDPVDRHARHRRRAGIGAGGEDAARPSAE